jgi:hypothetical protein
LYRQSEQLAYGMRKTTLFKRTDLRRAIDTARQAGLAIESVEITKDGAIRVMTGKGGTATGTDLDNWLAKEGKGARPT